VAAPAVDAEVSVGPDAVYEVYFHGPAYQVVGRAGRAGASIRADLAAGLPSNHAPAELPLLAAPRLVELCFQAAGLDELVEHQRVGLPNTVERVELFSPVEQEGAAAVVAADGAGGYVATVVDADGNVLARLVGYRTISLPDVADATALAPLRGVVV
jgi:hypothetical protein